AWLKANKYGRVPTLMDHSAADGKAMGLDQSAAIMLYVAEKSGRLVPHTPRERAECYRWLMLHANDLGPAFNNSYYMARLPDAPKAAVKFFRDRTERYCRMIDDRLKKTRFLAGDEFSIADCAIYPDATWAVKDFAGAKKLKNLQRWVKEVGARPAVAKAMKWGA
ncbi:MAG: glutathione S-transferase family protein, partial [Pseudomonadota bacterium]